MPRTAAPTALVLLLAATALGPRDDPTVAAARIEQQAIRSHLYFLSHDALEGRGPGTRGGEAAAVYIAAQMERIGLDPVDGSYYQHVPLSARTVETASLSVEFAGAEGAAAASFGEDVVLWAAADEPLVEIEAPVVFVGYGIAAPEYGWDDFEDRDVRGKVLLVLPGDPPAPPDEPALFGGRAMTYYGRWTYKTEEARRRGAAGVLLIHSDESAGYPWSVVRSSWTGERLFPRQQPGATAPLRVVGWLHGGYAQRLLAAGRLNLGELHVRAARRDFRPADTGLTARVSLPSRIRELRSPNVVGMVRGSDPDRRHEAIVYTAHYDHLGIGPSVDGDSIYNGAYDNASGVAAMLEIAAAFATLERPPARSVLFLATTAEESGLLGAHHFVRNPPASARRAVANINLDGVNVWGETDDVVALGGERSTLGAAVETRAEELGVRVTTDRAPERGFYFRSDHFAFARAGIPAIAIEHGTEFRGRPPGWGVATLQRYHAERYHRPGDRYDPGLDLAGAVQQARLAFLVGYDVAQARDRPRWHETAAIPGLVRRPPPP